MFEKLKVMLRHPPLSVWLSMVFLVALLFDLELEHAPPLVAFILAVCFFLSVIVTVDHFFKDR